VVGNAQQAVSYRGQASGSSWLISAITDNTGKAETFGYSGGTLATITSTTSGRALHLTWSTPGGAASPHVATISTDPATAGQPGTALTWTYGYTGDLLTSVCPPGTTSACTSYGYITNGSHAATSVLNADPTSYYRMDDPAGNGHLQGYGGSYPAAMSSPAAVNDGAWHQAVLIPGQALYLDGVKVATATAGFTAPSSSVYALLGAGLIPQGGPYSSWSYFNGSITDLSFYHNQLPSTGTVAAQYAAETHAAAELNSVTSPAGRSELSATYDTVNDRVTALTDAAGGTWNYSGPALGASSAAYDRAVMGSSRVDFWPLNDASGPLARDMTDSAADSASPRPAATYANVTLGVAGPDGLADGNAAGFGGTNSQVSIPGGYFGGTGAESAELWFSTTGNGTLLSSGSGQNGSRWHCGCHRDTSAWSGRSAAPR